MKSWILLISLTIYTLDLLSQNDEFESICTQNDWLRINEVEGWNADQLELFNVGVTNKGNITLMPYTSSWYADYRGVLVFKEIDGDFAFTSKVIVTNRAGDDIPSSSSPYSLGGLMIRNPTGLSNGSAGWQTGQQNYIFLSMGYAATNHPSCNGCPAPHFEVKSTLNSNSTLEVSSIDTTAAELRFVRIDDAMLVLYRFPGDDWEVHRRYSRSDFGDTLQVGFTCYTDWDKVFTYSYLDHNANVLDGVNDPPPQNNPGQPYNPDMITQYEYARFDPVMVPPAFTGLDLSNPAEISDMELLSFLSFESAPDTTYIGQKWLGAANNSWTDPDNWLSGIPSAADSVIVQDCSCPQANCPEITSNESIHSLDVHAGATLTVSAGVTLTILGNGVSPYFKNEGTILVDGILHIVNASQELINRGHIECRGTGQVIIE